MTRSCRAHYRFVRLEICNNHTEGEGRAGLAGKVSWVSGGLGSALEQIGASMLFSKGLLGIVTDPGSGDLVLLPSWVFSFHIYRGAENR